MPDANDDHGPSPAPGESGSTGGDPNAPVPAGQGMMKAPPVETRPAFDQDTPLARVQPRWRRSGLA